ncbi:MAG: 5-methyltetrahydropteroyltriglutamate--homocysteine S-methyltransferase, partial [Francisellaceae bacterium]|nr:5-methyltetrahydropteroyltriglutamate--homocysteine S-methyltransferase [Francisellaceae bacterium]
GFPRVGPKRELKKLVESYFKGDVNQDELVAQSKDICHLRLQTQVDLGLDMLTVGDFSLYDHVLDTSVMFQAIPERFKSGRRNSIDTMFRMARGRAPSGQDAHACEMTKWFNTNYHYIVPEFHASQSFKLDASKILAEVEQAKSFGKPIKAVVLGPLTYLWLGKSKSESCDRLGFLEALLPAYSELLLKLYDAGVEWAQIDEPILCLDLPSEWRMAFERAYNILSCCQIKKMITTYFGSVIDNLSVLKNLPVEGLHIDLIDAPNQMTAVIDQLPSYKNISLGVIDGRNIWRNDLDITLQRVKEAKENLGDRLWLGTSSSLLHTPVDLDLEVKLDDEIKQWLAFSHQKIKELVALTTALNGRLERVKSVFNISRNALQSRRSSKIIHDQKVKERVSNLTNKMFTRDSVFAARKQLQIAKHNLPILPTTTIGSFPQTNDIRQTRRDFKKGAISENDYVKYMRAEIATVIKEQEDLGLDVLVHGEPERNDMVEYFGELLNGMAFTQYGWVQSYGTRCVKPPIIYGDISRQKPMTLDWSTYANSITEKPVKGMLTGPVTILCWSFVRNDQPLETTANHIALAIRDEISDLESAGVDIIQVDEPAFREGLPLKLEEQRQYLEWAVRSFRLSTSGVKDETQIHTHMCYSEFNELIQEISDMDADVITIENSRSDDELLDIFEKFEYPNDIGPGVYDIHSPIVPEVEAMAHLLERAAKRIPLANLWVNPDCGLKTRNWPEVREALRNMVLAAEYCRKNIKESSVITDDLAAG